MQNMQQACLPNGTDKGGEECLSHGLLPLSGVQEAAKVSVLITSPQSLSIAFNHRSNLI